MSINKTFDSFLSMLYIFDFLKLVCDILAADKQTWKVIWGLKFCGLFGLFNF